MNRVVSILALLTACAAVVVTASALLTGDRVVDSPDQGSATATPTPSVALNDMETDDQAPLAFAPLFGTLRSTPVRHDAPRAKPAQMIDLSLTGVLVAGETRWAMLQGVEGGFVVREGDAFGEGYEITRVGADRVTVTVGDTTAVLPLETAPPASGTGGLLPRPAEARSYEKTEPYREMVASVRMSREDVEALVAMSALR